MAEKVQAPTIPAGMSKEQVDKLWATFLKQQVDGKARAKAETAAIKFLKTKYQAEYKAEFDKNMPKGS